MKGRNVQGFCPRDQVDIGGPEIALTPEQVQPISLLLHELATNANKYGAFSRDGGHLSVTWKLVQRQVTLKWRETGGPPVTAPTREGFGSTLKNRVVRQINGSITRKWDPAGLIAEVTFPL